MKRKLLRLAAWALGIALVVLAVAVSGVVPVAASSRHWAVTRWFLELTMRRSVAVRTIGTHVPELDDPRLVVRGAGHYELGCRPCHGAPGVAQLPVPAAMTPRPPDLGHAAPRFDDAELHYVVLHGIKMTGMPAWPAPEREDEVWAMVAFLRALPGLDGAGYRELVHGPLDGATSVEGAVERCASCHGADGLGRYGAFPVLAGQRAAYLLASLRAYAAGERRSGTMQEVASRLEPDAMEALARHFAALPGPSGSAARPPPRAAREDELVRRGESLALSGRPARRVPSCADCHGPAREETRDVYPRLAGQHADYLVQQLRLFAEGRRGGTPFAPLMREVAHGLEEDEMRAVAAYYASSSAAQGGDGR